MSINRTILIITVCCLLFSNCNVFESPYQMSFISNNFIKEYVILSKINGKPIYHRELPANTKMTYKGLKNSTFHLTSVDISEYASSSSGAPDFRGHLTTFLDVPAGDYGMEETLASCCSVTAPHYYVQVKNIGNFTFTDDNPFYATSGETISYDPSNGGTLLARIQSGSNRAYIAFNLDDESNRKYFYQSHVEKNDTITIDYSILPSLSTSKKIMFDDTYTHGHCTIDGYDEDFRSDYYTPFTSAYQPNFNEVEIFIPPIIDFDFFWTNISISKSNRSYRRSQRSNNQSEIPQTVNFPDWTFTVEDERIICPKISTTGDFDYVELNYKFITDGFAEILNWTIFAPKALVINIPEIEIPSELLVNHPGLENIDNLELEYVRLIAHPDINDYGDFIEFALISNENFDRYSYEILTGK